MENIRYEKVDPVNEIQCAVFRKMMCDYSEELGGMDEFAKETDRNTIIEKWIQSIFKLLGPSDRYLELCWLGNIPAGFLYGKIDHEEDRGFVKPGYGYVMEFYVVPQMRRKGIGRAMYAHLEQCFSSDGANRVYLTTDTQDGIAFWEKIGFVNSHKKSSDNETDIYEKTIE